MTDKEYETISKICLEEKIDGIIVGGCIPTDIKEAKGGVGGKVVAEYSLKALKTVQKFTQGKIPLVSSGGIFTGKDVLEWL